MFNIENIGYNYKESKTFKINRPNGSHNYLFIFFPSEVTISVENVLNDVKQNSCIIYTPDCPQLYYNEKAGFVNHWVHFTNECAETFFKNIQIPLNVPFYINDYSFIPLFFKNVEMEYMKKDMFWKQNIDAIMTSNFILMAREYHNQARHAVNPYKTELIKKFKLMRIEIMTNLEHHWTIDEMCSMVQLSRSRFTVLYNEFFKVSPKEDIIAERIKKAKYLLSCNSMSVSSVAYSVGYDNIYHFNRQFKKMTGIAPGRYAAKFNAI